MNSAGYFTKRSGETKNERHEKFESDLSYNERTS